MENCLFCKIIQGDIPSTPVYTNDWVYAFNDINPEAPTHILIVPRKHLNNLAEAGPDDVALLGHIQLAASEIAQQLGVATDGFRVVTNCGPLGGQTVGHLHYHFIAGRQMHWPPG